MAMDISSCGFTVESELYRRSGEFNGGNPNNNVDYITHKVEGNLIIADIGMTLVSKAYVSSIERQIRLVIDRIKMEYAIPYAITFSLGYIVND